MAPRPLRDRWVDVPHASRLSPSDPGYEAAIEAHRRAIAEGRDGYLDPATGLFVMTARYLEARGDCCDSACRHCPWVGA